MRDVGAELLCGGCGEAALVPVPSMRVEREALLWDCPNCGSRSRPLDRLELRMLSRAFDKPGGTIISEREVRSFVRNLRRLEQHLDNEGLCAGSDA